MEKVREGDERRRQKATEGSLPYDAEVEGENEGADGPQPRLAAPQRHEASVEERVGGEHRVVDRGEP